MTPYISYLNKNINKNEKELSKYAGIIKWVNSSQAIELENSRNVLFENMKDEIHLSCNQSKPWYKYLSEGCKLCTEGKWSCLFISGVCNAKCFFCPTRQDVENEVPSSQMKSFETPEDYADYINYFGFKGVSLSGGEPLLDIEKTISYIKAVREKCDPDIYIWVYTNGLIGTEENFKLLKNAGVNEVRFNLCASGYDLSLIEKASGIIDNITVEIPAVPEDCEKLIEMLPKLVKLGVKYLNLHTLRPTEYNIEKILHRPYTLAHGEAPIIIESELTALTVMEFAASNKLDIGINYCSYNYKYNFQKSGYRSIVSEKLKSEFQEVTDKGYLRTIKTTSDNGDEFISLNYLKENISNIDEVIVSYENFVITDNNLNNDSEAFSINDKPYSLYKLNKTNEIILSAKLYLETIHNVSADNIKSEELFELFKLESFEEETPQYY